MISRRRLLLGCAASALLVGAAKADYGAGGHLTGFWAGGEPAELTYIGFNSSTSDSASYNFGTFDVGTGNPEVIVATGARDTTPRTLSSISIGGTNGTIHLDNTGSTGNMQGIASRLIAGGGSPNVTVNWSAAPNRCACYVYALRKHQSATPNDTDSYIGPGGETSQQVTVDIRSGGVAIFAMVKNSTSAIGWSSATEREDFTLESATRFSNADIASSPGATGHTETASWTGGAFASMIGAAWR